MKIVSYLRQNNWLIIVSILVLILFFPSIQTFFAQDDFWLLKISQIKNLSEFFQFFIPRHDVVWYRPLSSQIFFFLNRIVFGLNPFLYHGAVMLTHLATGYFLFKFISLLTNQKKLAALSACLYVLHQIHTISLSWLASYSFILGPLLLVLLLYFYQQKKYIPAFIISVLGLLTIELFIIFIAILFIFDILINKKIFIIRWILFSLPAIFIFLLRYIFFPTSVTTSLYTFTISSNIFSNLKFYSSQLLGLPLLVKELPLPLLFISVILFCILSLWIALLTIRLLKNKFIPKWIFLCLSASGIGLAPFLLLPFHIAPYYAAFALIGITPIWAYLILQQRNKILIGIFLSIFLILQLIGIYWTYETHWVFKRAALAKQLINKQDLIHPAGSEEYFSLGADAASVVFK